MNLNIWFNYQFWPALLEYKQNNSISTTSCLVKLTHTINKWKCLPIIIVSFFDSFSTETNTITMSVYGVLRFDINKTIYEFEIINVFHIKTKIFLIDCINIQFYKMHPDSILRYSTCVFLLFWYVGIQVYMISFNSKVKG